MAAQMMARWRLKQLHYGGSNNGMMDGMMDGMMVA
jgi:hypothetical protein